MNFISNTKKMIPHKIWILWFQGLSEAPYIVRKCIDSWITENPTWDVIVLDYHTIKIYIDLDLTERAFANLSLNHQSNLVRLALLSKYGGVWADATTFCMKPLDEWIDEVTLSGFFAFYKPARTRIMSNWFIIAEEKCPLILKLYDQYTLYWKQNQFNQPNELQRKIKKLLSKILNRNEKTTKYWFSPIVTKILKVSPYFGFHYMFARLVSADIECQNIWKNTPKVSANDPHLIQKHGFFSPPCSSITKKIDSKDVPLFKLSWKKWEKDQHKYSSNTLLHYLLEGKR